MKLELGISVRCADNAARELVDVVIDSRSNRVTHVVVQPHEQPDAARLVPIQLAQDSQDCPGGISLNCNAADLEKFEHVHHFEVLHAGERPDESPQWDVGVEDIVVVPNYAPSAFGDYVGELDSDVTISYDRVPKGEIELRRVSAVYSSDGHHLGSVDGVVVNAGRLTHLLLERGHLWWKREVAVPAKAISKIESDMVTLGVTKGELAAVRSSA
jgi:sporulation protein YlmC with PRC-barrel domain